METQQNVEPQEINNEREIIEWLGLGHAPNIQEVVKKSLSDTYGKDRLGMESVLREMEGSGFEVPRSLVDSALKGELKTQVSISLLEKITLFRKDDDTRYLVRVPILKEQVIPVVEYLAELGITVPKVGKDQGEGKNEQTFFWPPNEWNNPPLYTKVEQTNSSFLYDTKNPNIKIKVSWGEGLSSSAQTGNRPKAERISLVLVPNIE